MITLGMETSGREGSLALLDGGQLIGQRDLSREGRRHARSLLAEVQSLILEADLTARDVDVLAVSIGPGSFTGLRIGVTCAKTWAYATGCRVVGVETFLAVAERSAATGPELHVISDAQRGDLFVGHYVRRAEESWQRVGDIAILNADEWIDSRISQIAVSGPAVNQWRESFAGDVRLERVELCHPRAEETARIGHRLCERGASDDIWQLEPLYLRRSAAEENADRTADF